MWGVEFILELFWLLHAVNSSEIKNILGEIFSQSEKDYLYCFMFMSQHCLTVVIVVVKMSSIVCNCKEDKARRVFL